MFSVNQHRFTEINDNEFMRDERTIKYNFVHVLAILPSKNSLFEFFE